MPDFMTFGDYSGHDVALETYDPPTRRVCLQFVGTVIDPITGLERQFHNSCERDDILNQVPTPIQSSPYGPNTGIVPPNHQNPPDEGGVMQTPGLGGEDSSGGFETPINDAQPTSSTSISEEEKQIVLRRILTSLILLSFGS